ncbi:hypothetical protein FACS1894195_5690 [Bacteroidia bacterium]|nr:hypothetical protein FACS1894195_5690 [Bacteroidia bacterium]
MLVAVLLAFYWCSITPLWEHYLAAPPPPGGGCDVFDGWWTALEGGEKYTAETVFMLDHDVTLYAHWKKKPYTISFSPGTNGSGTMLPAVVNCGDNYTAPFNGFTPNAGYQFVKWVFNGSDYSPGSSISSTAISAGLAGTTTITLTAQWRANDYTLSFRDGSIAFGSDTTITYITPVGNRLNYHPTPTNMCLEFAGWFDAPTSGTEYTSATIFSETHNLTLYARWTAKKIVVGFQAGDEGSGGNMDPVRVNC